MTVNDETINDLFSEAVKMPTEKMWVLVLRILEEIQLRWDATRQAEV